MLQPTPSPAPRTSLRIRMATGAGIGLVLISLFLFSADEPDPAWGEYWMIRPLIIVPLAGAIGGVCFYFILKYRFLTGINKTAAFVISALIFIIGLWLGVVLGLDGTLWD